MLIGWTLCKCKTLRTWWAQCKWWTLCKFKPLCIWWTLCKWWILCNCKTLCKWWILCKWWTLCRCKILCKWWTPCKCRCSKSKWNYNNRRCNTSNNYRWCKPWIAWTKWCSSSNHNRIWIVLVPNTLRWAKSKDLLILKVSMNLCI